MADSVTRCPHCKTSFRIRDEHLKVARGAVRCGSCLEVFKATEHLISPPSLTEPEPAVPTLNTPDNEPSPAVQNTSPDSLENQQEVDANELFDSMFGDPGDDDTDSDPFAFSDGEDSLSDLPSEQGEWGEEVSDFGDLLGDSLAGTAAQEPPVAQPQTAIQDDEEEELLFHDDMDNDEDDFLIHDDMDGDDGDEMISDDPFADLGLREPDELARPKPMAGLDLDESLLDSTQAELDDTLLPDEGDESTNNDDEAWAKALLEDDEPPEDITRELGLDTAPEPRQDIPPSETAITPPPATSRTRTSSVKFALADDDSTDEETPQTRSRTIEIPTKAMRDIQPEPIKLENAAKPEVDKDYAGWVTGSVVLLLLAALQLFYFNFDQWARTPQWRPAYTSVCSVLGCELPAVQDVRRLKARNLVVRSHPTVASALVVDTLMQNESSFPQPFPDLVLIFRDLNDNVVASRQFSPEEYLSGEMSGRQDIPSRTPVHIGIEILDPGQNAVSYAIQLAPNQ